MATKDEFADPEMSFRRGYVHGAWILFKEIESALTPPQRETIRNWIERDLANWRLNNLKGLSERPSVMIPSGEFAPPPLRLKGSK
jgi:hypothetical protein